MDPGLDISGSGSEWSLGSEVGGAAGSDDELWDWDDDQHGAEQVLADGDGGLWRHREGRKEKVANKIRARMDMEERIRDLQFEGETEFQATYKLNIEEFRRLAQRFGEWLDLVEHKAVCSSGSLVSAELRLSMAMRFFAGGHVRDICHMHGVHNSTFYKAVWQFVDFVNFDIPLQYPLHDEAALDGIASGFNNITRGVISKCAGAIDGIAIQIKCPKLYDTPNPMHFYNRKGFYAYVMQGVCDAKLRCVSSDHHLHARQP